MSANAGRPTTGNARRRAVMQRLALDAAAIEAVEALRGAGICSILLKGPAIATWLYDQPWERVYADVDLLVAPADHDGAAQILTRLGYRATWPLERVNPHHASTWTRRGTHPAAVDLHWRLPLAREGLAPWSLLRTETEPLVLGATTVQMLSPAARAMWVALHATQHGVGFARPMRDLEQALARVDFDTWSAAAKLARRLGLEGEFGAGLRLIGAGAELATRLALRTPASVEAHLRSRSPADTSLGLMHLLEQHSARARLRLLWAELLPSPAFMRLWSPMARRGRWGLLCAYLWRPAWLLVQLPAGMRDLARARRSARD